MHKEPLKTFGLFTCCCRFSTSACEVGLVTLVPLTQHPVKNLQPHTSKNESPHSSCCSGSTHTLTTFLKKSFICIWWTARRVWWAYESRQGQSVRSSGGNRESVFHMHRWRQCGGSDVAGIITGWQSAQKHLGQSALSLCCL